MLIMPSCHKFLSFSSFSSICLNLSHNETTCHEFKLLQKEFPRNDLLVKKERMSVMREGFLFRKIYEITEDTCLCFSIEH